MAKEKNENQVKESMEDLENFYLRKKEEQEALRKLLDALEKKSKDENENHRMEEG
jgi:hypothetical protein